MKNFLLIFFSTAALFADPLPSWNNLENKKAILSYVEEVTERDKPNYIPLEERIAVFDEDGTLWVEQPLYAEFFFVIDRVNTLAKDHPEWEDKEPYKTVLENPEKLKDLSSDQIKELFSATHSNITIEEFHRIVMDWIKNFRQPRFKKPYTELVYKPMMELMEHLKNNQFQVYIVSGGGQEFMRSYTEKLYGLQNDKIVGTSQEVKYEYRNGHPELVKLPEILFINNKAGKPEGINLLIGKKPVAAFGNSTGDLEMLQWTESNLRKTLKLLVHHDDAEREYSYGPNSKIGTFSDALMNEAKSHGWLIVSMKNDWKTIFEEVK